VGDWFYAPGFTYDSGMMIRYITEAAARDGNAAICISLLPDGSLDDGCRQMLKEVGVWMRCNGEGIYGSHAWKIPGEGEMVNGKLKQLPGGALRKQHADFKFGPQDFRFTVGSNGCLYAYCLTVPAPGALLKITSLGTRANLLAQPVTSVSLLGSTHPLVWTQQADGLVIHLPEQMSLATAIGFKIGPPESIGNLKDSHSGEIRTTTK
jgi:alpha-L-fucosidase